MRLYHTTTLGEPVRHHVPPVLEIGDDIIPVDRATHHHLTHVAGRLLEQAMSDLAIARHYYQLASERCDLPAGGAL
jgi:hypothetical protein